MLGLVAKLNKSTIGTNGDGALEVCWLNIRNRAYRLAWMVKNKNPDMYTVEFLLPGSVIAESLDFETIEGGLSCFDGAIRSGAVYALFKGIWNSPTGEGEVMVNIGLHDLSA